MLTFAELAEIDRLSYFKANTILGEAQTRLGCFDYDLAVRRAQEAIELYLKSLFRFLQAEYPATHDVKKQIYELTAAFKQHRSNPIKSRLAKSLGWCSRIHASPVALSRILWG